VPTKEAAEAHSWLSYIDIRKGRYKAAAAQIEASNGDQRDPLAATFRELPDQAIEMTSPATIPYRILERKLFLEITVDRQPVEFFLDSDANLSFVSETAAKRIGLAVRHSSATTEGALGAKAKLSIASANVVIGNTRLNGVAFLVLPDSASLFATLAPKQQGALGLPVLIALERVSWDSNGKFRIGIGYDPARPASPLAFDGSDPVIRFTCNQVALTGVFDTGAETTTLWPPFAARFSRFVSSAGTVGSKEMRGFGGNGRVPEILLPNLEFGLGGINVRATPAHILTAKTTDNSDWLAGRIGLDLLREAQCVTVDLRANMLQLAR
jgi:predicted aspartyl protease